MHWIALISFGYRIYIGDLTIGQVVDIRSYVEWVGHR